MKDEVLFTEKQHFNQWWFWLVIILTIGIPLFFIVQNGFKHNYNLQQYINSANITAIILPLLIVVFLLINRLDTQITSDGIRVRYFPFHLQYKFYPTKIVGTAYVRQYDPIGEYGGWGLRFGLFGKGKAYNVSGNQGIQLVFKDGSKLLIGTQKPTEANAALQKVGYLQEELH